ncbi:MAG: hypothetical protein CMP98_11560 [Gammaproteobacteria bacterium]|nr:hypothetical protein [Gammaproteobacteria bacterium]
MLICTRMASRHSNSRSVKKDTIGTQVTTFGILQIKRTTVHRFLTQRSIQLGSAQAVISAVKNDNAEVAAVPDSDCPPALAEEPGVALSARVMHFAVSE